MPSSCPDKETRNTSTYNDSKFPLADYYRLEEAYEAGDKDEIEHCRRSLLTSVKRFAKDIKSKYIAPPRTTNFGVLFVPTEGLYSEIVRNPVFFDDLRREEQIIVAGPSTCQLSSIPYQLVSKLSISKRVRTILAKL